MRKRLLNILFWSIISAAFIGPGTITTASKAGASFQFQLLWALVFSTIACLVLQEAAARLTIHSGKTLGAAIRYQFKGTSGYTVIIVLVAGAIIFGSAAYETGNLLGAVAGLGFIINGRPQLLILLIGGVAFLILSLPSIRGIAHLMGYIVVIMGISFLGSALILKPDFGELLRGGLIPSIPENSGAGLLVLGLIGTTVVPYNLFLGSGLSKNAASVREMRYGLSIAVILGGCISIAVLFVGSFVEGPFSFEALVSRLDTTLGKWATIMFGLGMLAAGFSSAVTAPLASAMTADSLFSGDGKFQWGEKSRKYRYTWGFVLLTGVVLGLSGFKPIPAIIIAQALNGFILPFISIFLVMVINDPEIIGSQNMNSWISNVLLLAVVWITLILGISNLIKVANQIIPSGLLPGNTALVTNIAVSTVIWFYCIVKVIKLRRKTMFK